MQETGTMTLEQTVTIPADYRIFLDLPRSLPVGVAARIKISIPENPPPPSDDIENVRRLLQEEMSERDTLAASAVAGDGWEAHVGERYAEY